LVYQAHEKPDDLLHDFAAGLAVQGHRVVGLVQLAHHCKGAELSAMMVHSGERPQLFQDLGTGAKGCKLDVDRLVRAGAQIADEVSLGADLLIINRFGKHEQEGKGLLFLIEHALGLDIPVLIAVPDTRFSHWINFSSGMSVKLRCDRASLDGWWRTVSKRGGDLSDHHHQTVCEAFK
jgi:hypothetical protein